MRKLIILLFLAILILASCYTQPDQSRSQTEMERGLIVEPLALIPQPVSIERTGESFSVDGDTVVYFTPGLENEASFLKNFFAENYSLDLATKIVVNQTPENGIILQAGNIEIPDEGYLFSVKKDTIIIEGKNQVGVFYGLQTLRQIITPELLVPDVAIYDYPNYSWRGNMLDSARHMMSVEYIKKHIDRLALFKHNVFHWHLADDQGWRVEIKSRPQLTEIGAYRDEDGTIYGGFYTQDEIRAVVAYAKERHITVIPEIDMPGHATAMIASYPELSCHKQQVLVETEWGIFDQLLCPSNEYTYAFIDDVISELTDLFPGPYFHIGGDEAFDFTYWQTCEDCDNKMKEIGKPRNIHMLQAYFYNRLEKMVKSYQKTMIAWNDNSSDFKDLNTIVHFWSNLDNVFPAIRKGHKIIFSVNNSVYLDMTYRAPQKRLWAGYTDLKEAYETEPEDFLFGSMDSILGIESCMWTEHTPNPEDVDYKVFPRLPAIAESAWSQPENRDWKDFQTRIALWGRKFRDMDINFYESPMIDWIF